MSDYPTEFALANNPPYSPNFPIAPDVHAAIGAALLDAFHDITCEFEIGNDDVRAETIEHLSRSGFWSWNSGGYEIRGRVGLSYLNSTGKMPSGQCREFAQKQMDRDYNYAREALRDAFPAETAGIADEALNYSELHDAGKGDLAEWLSECEHTVMMDDIADPVLRVVYYSANATGRPRSIEEPCVTFCAGWDFNETDRYGSRFLDPRWNFDRTLPLSKLTAENVGNVIRRAARAI